MLLRYSTAGACALTITLLLVLVFACDARAAGHRATPLITARHSIDFYRAATWRWQSQMAAPKTRSNYAEKQSHSTAYLHYLTDRWRARAHTARSTYRSWFSNIYAKWACIHGGEGAWNSNTGNGYYGGLQMDLSFQRSYGAEFFRFGFAHRWPVWAQLIAAERAYKSGRGFYPWPNTARACGLI